VTPLGETTGMVATTSCTYWNVTSVTTTGFTVELRACSGGSATNASTAFTFAYVATEDGGSNAGQQTFDGGTDSDIVASSGAPVNYYGGPDSVAATSSTSTANTLTPSQNITLLGISATITPSVTTTTTLSFTVRTFTGTGGSGTGTDQVTLSCTVPAGGTTCSTTGASIPVTTSQSFNMHIVQATNQSSNTVTARWTITHQ
jgi:hypothetical protein